MDAEKDNANPTIINPSDLPTRLAASSSQASQKARGIFSALAPPQLYSANGDDLTFSEDELSSNSEEDDDAAAREEIDAQEVFDLIAPIMDPEHPLSLGSLGVVNLADITLFPPSTPTSRISAVQVLLTPTTSACSLTTVIGLGVKVRLTEALPPRFRVDVRIKEGTSASAPEANKQLADKERVAAAMENRNLIGMVQHMLSSCV